ncbi:hypothetical protein J6590_016529 [Homalodisca vitripennis]|nr:hypothetical protein J6590_016529 [Homalodisca vitripennis]
MVGDFPSFEYLVRYTHARRATVQSNELYRQAALLGPGCYTLYTEPRNLRVRTNTFKARTSMRRDDQQGTHDLRSWTSKVKSVNVRGSKAVLGEGGVVKGWGQGKRGNNRWSLIIAGKGEREWISQQFWGGGGGQQQVPHKADIPRQSVCQHGILLCRPLLT